MTVQEGWLIERRRGTEVDWMTINPDLNSAWFWFDWTPESLSGLRFARGYDAERLIRVVAPIEFHAEPDARLSVKFYQWEDA